LFLLDLNPQTITAPWLMIERPFLGTSLCGRRQPCPNQIQLDAGGRHHASPPIPLLRNPSQEANHPDSGNGCAQAGGYEIPGCWTS